MENNYGYGVRKTEDGGPILNSGPNSTAGSVKSDEGNKDYLNTVYHSSQSEFTQCRRSGSEAHVILSGGGGARWGKQSIKDNTVGLCGNCLLIQINNLPEIFSKLQEMEKHVKYLKNSKQYSPSSTIEGNAYRTFSLEQTSPYRNTGIVFNDGKFGLARYYNPYLASGKGPNQFILARHSLMTFEKMDYIFWSLKSVLDAAIVSLAQKSEFVRMTFYILSELILMNNEDFVKTCSGPKILKKIPQLFRRGLGYLPEKERELVQDQKTDFSRLVCLEYPIIKIIRDSTQILKQRLTKAG